MVVSVSEIERECEGGGSEKEARSSRRATLSFDLLTAITAAVSLCTLQQPLIENDIIHPTSYTASSLDVALVHCAAEPIRSDPGYVVCC